MGNLIRSIFCGFLALSIPSAVLAEDSTQQNDGRRLAIALPKAPTQQAKQVDPARIPAKSLEPAAEFASRPRIISNPSQPGEMPEHVRAVLIDGAEKAEQLSRSYNRRIADVIFWLANSFNNGSTLTPAVGPGLQRSQRVDFKRQVPNEHQNAIFQID